MFARCDFTVFDVYVYSAYILYNIICVYIVGFTTLHCLIYNSS